MTMESLGPPSVSDVGASLMWGLAMGTSKRAGAFGGCLPVSSAVKRTPGLACGSCLGVSRGSSRSLEGTARASCAAFVPNSLASSILRRRRHWYKMSSAGVVPLPAPGGSGVVSLGCAEMRGVVLPGRRSSRWPHGGRAGSVKFRSDERADPSPAELTAPARLLSVLSLLSRSWLARS